MATEQVRRALHIGIDKYQFISPLEGCENDAVLMQSILKDTFGFQHQKLLVNDQATRKNILDAFDELVRDCGKDDVVVIQYAGHGSTIKDLEGDEPSGFDSTLMTVDTHGSFGKPEENLDITDDEIHLKLLALGEKTKFITLIVDACHSGTITRDGDEMVGPVRERGLPGDQRPPAFERIPQSEWSKLGASTTQASPSGWTSGSIDGKYVLIAGCRDEQKSGECPIQMDDGSVVKHGALTWFLSRELKKATSKTTYREIFERVAPNVTQFRGGRQHPQMEGTIDLAVFGVDEIAPMRFVAIEAREKGAATVTVAAGASLGMTRGSTLDVYPAGTTATEGVTPIGKLTITAVSAVNSTASIDDEPVKDAIVANARAVVTKLERGTSAVSVEITADEGDEAKSLRKAVEGSPVLRAPAVGETAALRVRLLEDRTLSAINLDGAVALPVKPIGEWKDMFSNLEKYSRYRYALALDNEDRQSGMRGKFTMELLKQNADGSWAVATPGSGGLPEFTNGDFIGARLKSTYDKDAFINVLDFGLSGRIIPQYPPLNATDTIAPGREFDLFTVTGRRKKFTIPDQYPYASSAAGDQQLEGIETLKLFVTTKAVKFEFLKDDEGFRDGGDEAPLESMDDWTTVSCPFILRKESSVQSDGTKPVEIGHAVVTAPGIAARIEGKWGSEAKASADEGLASAGFTVRQTLSISGEPSAGATRDAAPKSVDVEVTAPPAGYGQVLLSTDANGGMTWLFPQTASATRDSGERAAATQRFSVPFAGGETASGERGISLAVIMPVVKVLMFVVEPVAAAVGEWGAVKWEKSHHPYRVRTVSANTIANDDTTTIDRAGWEKLSKGPALLLLHGEMQHSNSFASLGTDALAKLDTKYEGRVFAFDHFTLGHDPLRNAQEFVKLLPEDLAFEIDILAHSRGGLLARMLAEPVDGVSLNGRKLKVRKVVLVGTPSGGTALASEAQLGDLMNVATNVAKAADVKIDATRATTLEVVKHLVLGLASGLVGLTAMTPKSDTIAKLKAKTAPDGTSYFAIGSEYAPRDSELKLLVAKRAAATVLGAASDLVVPTESTWATSTSALPAERRRLLAGLESESHFNYFASPIVQKQILSWLEAAS